MVVNLSQVIVVDVRESAGLIVLRWTAPYGLSWQLGDGERKFNEFTFGSPVDS